MNLYIYIYIFKCTYIMYMYMYMIYTYVLYHLYSSFLSFSVFHFTYQPAPWGPPGCGGGCISFYISAGPLGSARLRRRLASHRSLCKSTVTRQQSSILFRSMIYILGAVRQFSNTCHLSDSFWCSQGTYFYLNIWIHSLYNYICLYMYI